MPQSPQTAKDQRERRSAGVETGTNGKKEKKKGTQEEGEELAQSLQGSKKQQIKLRNADSTVERKEGVKEG